MSRVARLADRKLISPPTFLSTNTMYETVMGSEAYGLEKDDSDLDIYGFAIPPKDWMFPHLRGEVPGFDPYEQRFEQFQAHHVLSSDEGREYDLTIFNITKYFKLCMECNPNMIDSLFTDHDCILHITTVGRMVRDNRHLFLHKGAWHPFKGYAYSQLKKLSTKTPRGKRQADVEEHGMDTKYAYHLVRLLNEVEQILTEGDLDLRRNNEQLKSIRRGEWTEEEINEYFTHKERQLEQAYADSDLPNQPDVDAIRNLLMNCLEEHYGNLDEAVVNPNRAVQGLREVSHVIERYRHLL